MELGFLVVTWRQRREFKNMVLPEWVKAGRSKWEYRGQKRPPFAVTPQAGQESVWDYPRPPRIDAERREIVVSVGNVEIARTTRGFRVLETASPPTVYLPQAGIRMNHLVEATGQSLCEWKGSAQYWTVTADGKTLDRVAWSYPDPFPEFEAIRDHISFYPEHLDCFMDGVRVSPQPGKFYGGWVTPEITGPFKGEPGSANW